MYTPTTQILKYHSKDRTISRSRSHTDMWIVELDSGGWFNIVASQEWMLKVHPKDVVAPKKYKYFTVKEAA